MNRARLSIRCYVVATLLSAVCFAVIAGGDAGLLPQLLGALSFVLLVVGALVDPWRAPRPTAPIIEAGDRIEVAGHEATVERVDDPTSTVTVRWPS